ncbi:MAG: hypothetical protein WC325_06920 [Candidatus Bathyarchaeia archaeon]
MTLTPTPQYNIFSALHEAITEKANKELRFTKCQNCGRYTPYRLRFLADNRLVCKNCGTHLL